MQRRGSLATVSETPSRRDLNRERTRVALLDAVISVIETDGIEALSADLVADAAGVSRRTFFNYFAGVDAAVAACAQEVLGQIAAALNSRPADEPIVDSVVAAVEQVITVDVLRASAQIWRVADESPAARRFALEAVATHNDELAHAWGRERLARDGIEPDPLRESVVMATIQVAFDEARRLWLRQQTGPVDADALAEFRALTRGAWEMVRPVVEHRPG